MYPYWNLEELEYWKIAANTHFSLRGFELLGAEASRLRLILLVDIMSGAMRPGWRVSNLRSMHGSVLG